ncbi:MAG: DUF1289 domain-containing protein [Pseudomonadota bacterium]
MTPDALEVQSPCIKECVIDQYSGFCRGCWRTLDEISFWESYAPEHRRRVLHRLQERRNAEN